MDFTNLSEYILAAYGATVYQDVLEKEAPALLYLKLVRIHSRNSIQVAQTATELYAQAVNNDRYASTVRREMSAAQFALADLHEIIEVLIKKHEVKPHEKRPNFADRQFIHSVNS